MGVLYLAEGASLLDDGFTAGRGALGVEVEEGEDLDRDGANLGAVVALAGPPDGGEAAAPELGFEQVGAEAALVGGAREERVEGAQISPRR
jgi:hypothetical protein